MKQVAGDFTARRRPVPRIRERALDRGCGVVDAARRLGDIGQQADVIGMHARTLKQLRHVDPDDRAVKQQVLERRRAVIGNQDVGGDKAGTDIGGGGQHAAARPQVRRQSAPPVDAARILRPPIAGAIVQLHDHVGWKGTEPAYEVDAEQVERRSRGPRRRVHHSWPVRSQSQRAEHARAIERAVDQAVDLRHANQPDCRAVPVERAGSNAIGEPAAIDKEKAVPRAQ